jgi:hypothetical protein
MGISEAGAPLHNSTSSTSTTSISTSTAFLSPHQSPGQSPSQHRSHEPQDRGVRLPTVRYRGFVLIPQGGLTWLIRPERSPMRVLPFRAPASSISDVKALIDWRLNQVAAG